GYRIARRDYALPDVRLAPDETAAVGIAARLWQHAGMAAAASSGLLKLRAAGVDVDVSMTLGVEPLGTADPAFEPLQTAARRLPAAGGRCSRSTGPRRGPPRAPAGSSPGAWSRGAAAGTSWDSTWIGGRAAASACRGWSAGSRRSGRPAPSSRHPTWTSSPMW